MTLQLLCDVYASSLLHLNLEVLWDWVSMGLGFNGFLMLG